VVKTRKHKVDPRVENERRRLAAAATKVKKVYRMPQKKAPVYVPPAAINFVGRRKKHDAIVAQSE
jgi:hypothetical protein